MKTFAEDIKKEIERTERAIGLLSDRCGALKDGYLLFRGGVKDSLFYECDGKGKRIGDKGGAQYERVKEISTKHFLKAEIRDLESNLKLLNAALKKYKPTDADSVKATLPGTYREALDYCYPKLPKEERKVHVDGEYDSENPYDSDAIHITMDGQRVRSMAEVIIYNELLLSGLPFAYERKLELMTRDGFAETKYPDFTILIPGATFYWEHVGMYDDPLYRGSFEKKLKLYYDNDIVLGGNLIVTVSRGSRFIDSREIRRIIDCLERVYLEASADSGLGL